MKSKEFYVNEAERILHLLENYYTDTDIRLKDVLSDIRLLLYGYASDFPLLKDADNLLDKIGNSDMLRKCNITLENSMKFDEVEDMTGIIVKFISFLNTFR